MAESSAQPNGHEPAAASNGEAGQPTAAPKQDQVRRDILPIPDAKHVGLTTYDAKDPDTTYPPITALRPPKGAPNVLIEIATSAPGNSSVRPKDKAPIAEL